MPINNINALDGGINELANAETLKENQLKASSNYEILGDDKLTLRKEPEEYGDHVSGDSLKTVLDVIFSSSILQISPPLYPVKRIVDATGVRIMDGEFIILVYGLSGADFKLYLCYENTSNSWNATQVDITGIEYTSNTYLEFFVGDDKMIITDTYNETTNFPHYVKIDADGELITGLFSIKSPTNKATMEPVTEFDSGEFEEDADDVHLDDCGLVQCVYTVETKDGDESNPSPISDTRMMQFFKKDTIDKNDIRWIDNFQITNLSVPVLTGDLTEELKYFNVYFRVIRYSEGEAAEPFFFSQRFDIVDKENNTGDTGNGYLISVPQDESLLLSYENDIAPFAKHAAETSGIVGFANIREKIRFPFDFEKYCPILINNVNNKNFVDAIVYIRLYDENNAGVLDIDGNQVDMIGDLDITYYNDTTGDLVANLDLIRIYDEDKITPIKTSYVMYRGATYLDVYVKIPLLTAGQIKFLYLCFNTSTGTEEGVNIDNRKTSEYGEFTKIVDTSLFDAERVKSGKTVICSPMDYLKGDEVINLADDNNPGEILGDTGGFDDTLGTKQLFTQNALGSGNFLFKNEDGNTNSEFPEIKYSELPFELLPDKVAMWGRISYVDIDKAVVSNGLVNDGHIPTFNLRNTIEHDAIFLGIVVQNGEYYWSLMTTNDIDGWGLIEIKYSKLIFDELPISDVASGDIFLCVSIDKDENASLFIGNLSTGSYYYQEVDWGDWDIVAPHEEDGIEKFYENINAFSVGYNNLFSFMLPQTLEFRISQFQLTINKYYSAESDDDLTAIYNIANFMPGFETPLGQKIITT